MKKLVQISVALAVVGCGSGTKYSAAFKAHNGSDFPMTVEERLNESAMDNHCDHEIASQTVAVAPQADGSGSVSLTCDYVPEKGRVVVSLQVADAPLVWEYTSYITLADPAAILKKIRVKTSWQSKPQDVTITAAPNAEEPNLAHIFSTSYDSYATPVAEAELAYGSASGPLQITYLGKDRANTKEIGVPVELMAQETMHPTDKSTNTTGYEDEGYWYEPASEFGFGDKLTFSADGSEVTISCDKAGCEIKQ